MLFKVQRFFGINRTDRKLFIQASILSIKYSLYIFLIPKRHIFKKLGEKGVESMFTPTENELIEILQVSKAIRRAVRYLPGKTKCFAQAISAKKMLKQHKIPSTIYFGVAKEGNGKMIAHAWLCAGNITVTGKEEMNRFTPVLFFT